jgi:hypothetical protein
MFHKDCVDSWLSKSRLCPICKAAVDDEKLRGSSPV